MQGTSYSFPTQLPTRCGAIWRRVLRALADALEIQNLDGKFISASAAAGGRHDDRLHVRIVLDVAAHIIQTIAPDGSTLELDDQS